MSKYYMNYISEKKLIKLGFKPLNDWFVYSFPVYKWGSIPTLFGQIRILPEEKEIRLDVKDRNNNYYTPFYNDVYGDYSIMLNIIEANFQKQFKRLGIKEKENGKKEKVINKSRRRKQINK